MKTLIVCEGKDEVLLLGYLLHKTSGHAWAYNPKADVSKNNLFNIRPTRSEKLEIFQKQEDLAAIWAIGGNGNFDRAIKTIIDYANAFPSECFNEIVIVADRDETQIESLVLDLKKSFDINGMSVELTNNIRYEHVFSIYEETFTLGITPIIIPFEKNGALETILLDGISHIGPEEALIVSSSYEYIDELLSLGVITKYLCKRRHKLKAGFSVALSVINPEHSTGLYDELLLSHAWEEHTEVMRHFAMLISICCPS